MREALLKFARDVLEGAVAAGVVGVLALNLDVTSPRTVVLVFLYGAISGAIAAARRYLEPKP